MRNQIWQHITKIVSYQIFTSVVLYQISRKSYSGLWDPTILDSSISEKKNDISNWQMPAIKFLPVWDLLPFSRFSVKASLDFETV